MTNYLETEYKLFKTSWGILMSFKGTFIENPDKALLANAIKIDNNVYFEINISEKMNL